MPDLVWPSQLAKLFGLRAPTGRQEYEAEILRLFEELRLPLLRFLAMIGVAYADGEDILQEAFLALFQHLREGRPRDNLRAWLYRVVHNLGRKHLRRQTRMSVDGLASMPAADNWNPELATLWAQEARIVRSVMSALPEADRAVVMLQGQGLRYREIAEVLQISLGAVAQSLERSLGRLNAALNRR